MTTQIITTSACRIKGDSRGIISTTSVYTLKREMIPRISPTLVMPTLPGGGATEAAPPLTELLPSGVRIGGGRRFVRLHHHRWRSGRRFGRGRRIWSARRGRRGRSRRYIDIRRCARLIRLVVLRVRRQLIRHLLLGQVTLPLRSIPDVLRVVRRHFRESGVPREHRVTAANQDVDDGAVLQRDDDRAAITDHTAGGVHAEHSIADARVGTVDGCLTLRQVGAGRVQRTFELIEEPLTLAGEAAVFDQHVGVVGFRNGHQTERVRPGRQYRGILAGFRDQQLTLCITEVVRLECRRSVALFEVADHAVAHVVGRHLLEFSRTGVGCRVRRRRGRCRGCLRLCRGLRLGIGGHPGRGNEPQSQCHDCDDARNKCGHPESIFHDSSFRPFLGILVDASARVR